MLVLLPMFCSLSYLSNKANNFWSLEDCFDCFISAARSTRRKETHARLHANKTKWNTCEASSILEAITTPQHMQDEATGDVDWCNLNKHCTEQESLFQNKKANETLQPGHRKTCSYRVEVPQHNEKNSVILQ